MTKYTLFARASALAALALAFSGLPVLGGSHLDDFRATPPFHVHGRATTAPTGLSPAQVRVVYNLPSTGGSGTVAIIDAFDAPTVESDLNTFSSQYSLPSCTTSNGCFEKHLMASKIRADRGWALEAALDTQWAHAIAPNAKVLLVEAKSNSGTDLLAAVDYARNRADVVAISMSWGGGEFSSEPSFDFHFVSPFGATFFASSGDSGSGVIWPSVSVNVVAVGGTTLNFASGVFQSETAWSGSGGGLSAYESEPAYQTAYSVPNAAGKRAVPDVSYNADPASGYSVYDSFGFQGQTGWFKVGGTSAGAPQWAAIRALGGSADNSKFYQDAAGVNYASFFRDIVSGSNGTCSLYCLAGTAYDYVTGLGSPLTTSY